MIKLFKAVIIDDEFYVIEGMKKILDWESYGIEIAGTASDGCEGLEIVEKINPDIIITDIRMGNMDGLEMIEALRKRNFCGKIIILSGYQEFEYAQRAINNGVTRYILKPIDVSEFEKLIGDIIRELRSLEGAEQKDTSQIHTKIIHSKLASDIISYVDQHYTENIQLASLSEMFYCSIAHIGNIFKKNLGMNFTEYIVKKRIDKAKELLRGSHKSVEIIQFEVGYRDAKHFRKIFKDRTGMSPREFRQSNNKESDN